MFLVDHSHGTPNNQLQLPRPQVILGLPASQDLLVLDHDPGEPRPGTLEDLGTSRGQLQPPKENMGRKPWIKHGSYLKTYWIIYLFKEPAMVKPQQFFGQKVNGAKKKHGL